MTEVAAGPEQIMDGDSFVEHAGILLKEGELECPTPEDGFSLTDALIEPRELAEYIKKHPDKYVWTLIEEDGVQVFWAGVHFVNRLGYILTRLRADDPRFDSIRQEDGTVMVKYFEYEYDAEDNIVDL